MPLISAEYRETNRQLHDSEPTYGIGGGRWAAFVKALHDKEGYASILDYGCGKGILAQAVPDLSIAEYDPAIEGKDADPESAELVVCTDVLEHIEPEHLNAVLRHLASKTKRKLLFNIATRPAEKTLPDGRNPHLILRDGAWWRAKILQHFQIIMWREVGDRTIYGEAWPIDHKVMSLDQRAKMKRRPMKAVWHQMFDEIKERHGAYCDEFSRVRTIEMWEGVDDQLADMHVVVGILEDMEDIDETLQSIIKISRKAVMVHVVRTPERTETIWRNIFERYFRISDWHVDEPTGGIVMVGSPMIGVQGMHCIGVVDTEKRFEQVCAAIKRVNGRIEPAPPHGKLAILACYGPSMQDNIGALQDVARSSGGTVVSVSGAHDFLLSHGIVPDFHVECDPRPHKADNIEKPHPGVKYMLASCCHETVFDKLEGGDIRLWHIANMEHGNRIVDELGESARTVISGGGSVGLRAVPLLYQLGYRDFAIFGMDCSFKMEPGIYETVQSLLTEEPPKEKEAMDLVNANTQQWAGKHAGKRQDIVPCRCDMPDGTARIFMTSPQLMSYATGFFEMIQSISDVGFRVYGDSLLSAMCITYAHLPQIRHEQSNARAA